MAMRRHPGRRDAREVEHEDDDEADDRNALPKEASHETQVWTAPKHAGFQFYHRRRLGGVDHGEVLPAARIRGSISTSSRSTTTFATTNAVVPIWTITMTTL